MRITIDNFVVCGGDVTGEYPEAFAVNDEEILQIAQYLRASASVPIERGNTLVTVSFRITREHGTALLASEYALTHAASIPKTGTVIFQCEGPGIRKYKFTNGKIKSHKCEPIIGVTTIHNYVIQGGGFTTDLK